ncbi:hypothetical protein [Picosynechococcus sp. NKBG15041c]|uniref:hypothetical protein n=1 Tax=Picosynechococcus sp. NKBG15041c TaxID=1407650 RepID=UPI00056EAD9F|nr:hypothetical protein [Picosynechococcus sp. NKBG15041c]
MPKLISLSLAIYPAVTLKKFGSFSLFRQLNRSQPVVTLHSCPDLTYQALETLLTEQWLIPYQENNGQAMNLEQLIQEHLKGIKELTIIPHLGLHHIPFVALLLDDTQATVTSNFLGQHPH